MTLNIAEHCLLRTAREARLRDAVALTIASSTEPDRDFTFGAIAAQVERLARGLLAIGLAPGDRVLLRLPNGVEYALAFFGALRAGLVAVPSSAELTGAELRFLLEDSGVRAVVTDAERGRALEAMAPLPPSLRHVIGTGPMGALPPLRALCTHSLEELLLCSSNASVPETGDDDPAYLIYTSGTTARPKGVLHAHRSALGRDIVRREWEGIGEGDRVCHAGALNWTYTLGVGLMDPWSVGARSVLVHGPREPRVWPELIERLKITVFAAVPTVYRQILKYADVERHDWSSLRHGLTAGEVLPASVHEEWRRRVGTELYEALGMSEISTYVSFGPGQTVRPGATGRPQRGRAIGLFRLDSLERVGPGEIGRIGVHRSDPGLMLRYVDRADEEAEMFDGEWFFGGDLAIADDDGVYWFQGRKDEVVKTLGYRVSPVEVESVLGSHASVAECAVTAIETSEPGLQVLCAFLRGKDGHALERAALDAHCRGRLAPYKCPREYRLVDALPRTANGKLQRRALVHLPASTSSKLV